MRSIFWYFVDSTWPVWLSLELYFLPSVCQIATFSLLILYFAKQVHGRAHWPHMKQILGLCYAVANSTMVLMTFIIAGLTDVQGAIQNEEEHEKLLVLLDQFYYITSAVYFGVLVFLAAYYVYKLWTAARNPQSLLSHPSSHKRPSRLTILSVALVFAIFLSRCFYNIIAAVSSKKSFHIYPSTDLVQGDSYRKLISPSAFAMLVWWEIIPTFLVLCYFWVPSGENSLGDKIWRFFYGSPSNSTNNSHNLSDSEVIETLRSPSGVVRFYDSVKASPRASLDNYNSDEDILEEKSKPIPYRGLGATPRVYFDDPTRYDSDTEMFVPSDSGNPSDDSVKFSVSAPGPAFIKYIYTMADRR